MTGRNEEPRPLAGGGASGFSRRRFFGLMGASGAGAAAISGLPTVARATSHGGTRTIAEENALPGAPPSVWESWGDDESIAGFTTEYSVEPGDTVTFKIKTAASSYLVRIFRMGWYQGKGARKLEDVVPSASLPQAQPDPLTDESTGLIDCGNWSVSATWTVPADAVSGVYYALMDRTDGGRSSHTVFVVRRPEPSDILVQTSEMTSHAYNRYGGNSLYFGQPAGRAYKVSYNRPFNNGETESNFLNAEVALLRWLERNGYDVAYCGGIDVHRDPAVLQGRKIFISSGHDEYVTGKQRANVEAARDAGVHLIFMTGNEYFWKVRMEPSIDSSETPERTIVCYKETLASAKIDPSTEWTGTWRDPRFSPPSNGGRPENELTGQFFRAILPVSSPDFVITVPAEYAPYRLWRNTAVAALGPGESRDLAPNTLGYEFDVDADNGYRPPGLIRLSTTEAEVPQVLMDYGATYVQGTLTHHLTMYKAASGALVFGTGTVQWAYGLDEYHIADTGSPTDPVMQQATLNVLADMGVQPTTRMPGLVAASASSDTLAPSVTITSPAAGTKVPIGSPVTLTGTAVDAGGGIVASVEVSVDDGATWSMATGRDSWSYVFTPVVTGDFTMRARAIDDSCNIGQTANLALVGAPRSYPASIWPAGVTPQTEAVNETTPIEVGVRFQSSVEGFITGLRFYKGEGNTGTHVGTLWSASGAELASATFTDETATGWQTVVIPAVSIAAGTTYVASVFMAVGRYPADAGYFASAYELAPLRGLANGEDGQGNGTYRYGSAGFPTNSFGSTNYWVDIVFDTDNREAPAVADHAPGAGLQSVATGTALTVTFNEQVQSDSVTMTLTDAAGSDVPGQVAYDAATRTATFTPGAALLPLTQYSAQVATALDVADNPIEPFTWVFTTIGASGTSPMSLWDTSATPAKFDADRSSVELGVKFRASAAGSVTGLRFYKAPSSSGVHVGHLWDAVGTLLATATYGPETASGWQQVNLDPPVQLAAGETYVASYLAPKGVYGATAGEFTSDVARAPLRAPKGSSVGGNGVFAFGSGGFPVNDWNNTNYWIDVVFELAPDVGPPEVSNMEPAPDLIAVGRSVAVTAQFNEPIDASSLTFTLKDASDGTVAGSVAYDAETASAVFTPGSSLAAGAVYTASVQAADTQGNAMDQARVWSFTTVTPNGVSPTTLWDSSDRPAVEAVNESSAVELGVRVRASRPGEILGLRFFKGDGNNGPHLGHLWTAGGALLGTVTFAGETQRGWQQALFADPVAIEGDTVYVASYHAPSGRYSVTGGGLNSARTNGPLTAPASTNSAGNGVYIYGAGGFPTNSYGDGNYWVDVIFADSSAPAVQQRSPEAGATADPGVDVRATFNEDVVAASVVMSLRDGGGSAVGGALSYDETTRTAIFTPSQSLTAGATYTATVEAAEDLQGNAMSESVSWSFSILGAEYLSIWPFSAIPATVVTNDSSPLELGLKFRASAPGAIHGIRFYKGGPENSGPHTGNLWSADGTSLATVAFGGETARGWQTALFSTPVPLQVGDVYVVSYHAPQGKYSSEGGYFTNSGRVSGPLEALRDGEAGGNGLYLYSGVSVFPTKTYRAGNYWVDVLFIAD